LIPLNDGVLDPYVFKDGTRIVVVMEGGSTVELVAN